MRNTIIAVTIFMVNFSAFASYREHCDVKAKIVNIKEVSIFSTGSYRKTGRDPKNSFYKILEFEVLSAERTGDLGYTDCKQEVGKSYQTLLLPDFNIENQVGDIIDLEKDYSRGEIAHGLTWKFK